MARQARNLTALIIVVALVIFLASAHFGILPFSIGSSTLSLSKVDLQTNSPTGSPFSGKAWLLTFSSRELAQSYYGRFTPSQIQAFTDDESTTTESFSIETEYSPQVCRYDIRRDIDATPIYKSISQTGFGCGGLDPSLTESYARSKIPNGAYLLNYGGSLAPFRCYAIYATERALIGTFEQPDLESEFTITIKTDSGTTAKQTFNTLGATRGSIGNIAYAIWQGNLVSGQDCDEQSPRPLNQVKNAYTNGRWRTISSSSYQTYLNSLNDVGDISDSQRESNIQGLNTLSARALTSTSFGTINSATSQNNAFATLLLDSQVQFPITSIYIKADTLGIFTPVAKLRINSLSSNKFTTGDVGLISVQIENIGDVNTGYDVFAQCSNNFVSERRSGSIGSGEKRTINIPLRSGATQETTGTCEVFVDSTAGRISKSVSVSVTPLKTCPIPYPTKFCAIENSKTVVKQCSTDGATSNVIDICGSEEVCEEGKCIEQGTGGNFLQNLLGKIKTFFSSLFGGTFTIFLAFKYIVTVLVSVFVMFVSNDFLKIIRTLRDNKGVRVSFAILIGIGLGILLYMILSSIMFWVITILTVILLIFSSQIRGLLK